MGTENPVVEVENRVPGVRFSVVETSRSKRSAKVVLRCDVDDVELYDAAVAKLNGLKLFSGDFAGEVMDALGDELTNKHTALGEKDEQIKLLLTSLGEATKEIERLTGIMQKVGLDLGLVE